MLDGGGVWSWTEKCRRIAAKSQARDGQREGSNHVDGEVISTRTRGGRRRDEIIVDFYIAPL